MALVHGVRDDDDVVVHVRDGAVHVHVLHGVARHGHVQVLHVAVALRFNVLTVDFTCESHKLQTLTKLHRYHILISYPIYTP